MHSGCCQAHSRAATRAGRRTRRGYRSDPPEYAALRPYYRRAWLGRWAHHTARGTLECARRVMHGGCCQAHSRAEARVGRRTSRGYWSDSPEYAALRPYYRRAWLGPWAPCTMGISISVVHLKLVALATSACNYFAFLAPQPAPMQPPSPPAQATRTNSRKIAVARATIDIDRQTSPNQCSSNRRQSNDARTLAHVDDALPCDLESAASRARFPVTFWWLEPPLTVCACTPASNHFGATERTPRCARRHVAHTSSAPQSRR